MKKNGFAPVLIILVIIILGVVGYFVYKIRAYQTIKTVPSVISNTNWKVLDCNNCDVLRITKSVWNSPVTKTEPDKVWEIEAKAGAKTSDPNSEWALEIVSVNPENATVKFTGKIYKDMVSITDPITLSKWISTNFDTGTTGGGSAWEVLYLQKVK